MLDKRKKELKILFDLIWEYESVFQLLAEVNDCVGKRRVKSSGSKVRVWPRP